MKDCHGLRADTERPVTVNKGSGAEAMAVCGGETEPAPFPAVQTPYV